MNYFFVQPLLKQTLKPIEVKNENEIRVGYIQRFYKNTFQKILDFIIDGFYLHINVKDPESNVVVKAVQRYTLRDSWEIHENTEVYILKDQSKIKTNPRYLFAYKGKEYLIYKEYLDKYIRIKDISNNKIVSEFQYHKLAPPRKVSVKLFANDIDSHLSFCLYTLISLKY
ncbi:hypothetical protein NQZ71_25640 (plasmid) [Niallia taxi]|uniref:tubby C-terminal domain-like protein n=1 Tax=Niallia taxi TaxID=2499688 RepID=UPI0029348D70|nr:hypothetical protein [Niallia taxi]WOD65275.1 hypothetical protein NQZ71_25640 [Niallia taxi]